MHATPGGIGPQLPGSKCSVCRKSFLSVSSLNKHYVTHSEERSHVCSFCRKAFKRQDHMMNHMLTHLSIKPYQCLVPGCRKTYSDSRSLRRHGIDRHGLNTIKAAKDRPYVTRPLTEDTSVSTAAPTQSKAGLPRPQNKAGLPGSQRYAGLPGLQYNEGHPGLQYNEGHPGLQNNEGLPEPQSKAGHPGPQNNEGYPGPQNNEGLPEPQSKAGHPGPQNNEGYPGPQNNEGLPEPQSKAGHPGPQNNEGLPEPQSKAGHPGPQNNEGLPWPQSNEGLPWPQSNEGLLESSKVALTINHHLINMVPSRSEKETSRIASLSDQRLCLTSSESKVFWENQTEPRNAQSPSLYTLINTSMDPAPANIFIPLQTDSLWFDGLPSKAITSSPGAKSHRTLSKEDIPVRRGTSSMARPGEEAFSWQSVPSPFSALNPVPAACVSPSVSPCADIPFWPIVPFSGHQNDDILSLHPHKSENAIDPTRTPSRGLNVDTDSQEPILPDTHAPHSQKLPAVAQEQTLRNPVFIKSTDHDSSRDGRPWSCPDLQFLVKSSVSGPRGSDRYKRQPEDRETEPSSPRPASNESRHWHRVSSSLASATSPMPVASFPALTPEKDNKQYCIKCGEQKAGVSSPGTSRKRVESSPKSTTVSEKSCNALVIPVSVPVMMGTGHSYTQQEAGNRTGQEITRPPKKGKKIKPRLKTLTIPSLRDVRPGTSGCFQSKLRSPKGYPPYTPPPMLSPVRQSTGLYAHTLSLNTKCAATPDVTGTGGPSPGICLVEEDPKITVRPHINIGDRFQADISELRDSSLAQYEEETATLVWRPYPHQEAVSQLLRLACSSCVPGGSDNLELALHCLHGANGNIMDTLEMLLILEPREWLPRPLADYHYAGSDLWTASERKMFKKAYRAHMKDFSAIHKMVPSKSVRQCVEYYYSVKKRINFNKSPTPSAKKPAGGDIHRRVARWVRITPTPPAAQGPARRGTEKRGS